MHSDVNSVVCQPLSGCCERNQRRNTAIGKEDLAILACEIGVQAFILCGSVGVDCYRVPVVTHLWFWRAGSGVTVAYNLCIVAIDPSGKRQFTNGIVAYAREPFAKTD